MKTLFSCAAIALLCQGALADMKLTMHEKHAGMGQGEMKTVIAVRDGKVLFKQQGERKGSEVIYDSATDTITQIDHDAGTYMVVDKETMQQGVAKASEMMKQVEAQLANLPKEQREMMMKSMPGLAAQMGEKKPPKIDLEFNGKTRKIAGYDCRVATVREEGEDESIACIADRKELGISEADFGTLSSMFEMMNELASMGGESGMPDMRELGGYPIAFDNPGDGSKSELVAASNEDIESEMFEVPASYKRQSMPQF